MELFIEKYAAWIPEESEGAAFHVSNEEINSFYKNIRDWMGLTRERESYEARLAAGNGSTKARGFKFFWSSNIKRGPKKQATDKFSIGQDDIDHYNATYRKANHELLLAERARYEARPRDEDGRMLATEDEAYTFATDAIVRREGPEATYHHTVGKDELERESRLARARLSEDAEAQRLAFQQRVQYDENGYALTTEADPFALHESGYVPLPPTVYPDRASALDIAKTDADRRKEMEAALEEERAAYQHRMGLPETPRRSRGESAFSRKSTGPQQRGSESTAHHGQMAKTKAEMAAAERRNRVDTADLLAA